MFRAAVVLLIILAVVCVIFVALLATGLIEPLNQPGFITVFYFALSLFSILVVVLGLLGLLVWLIRLIHQPIFGDTLTVRLIALGAAGLLFSDVVVNVFRDLLTFSVNLLRAAPDQLFLNWQQTSPFCLDPTAFDLPTCLSSVGFGFLRGWSAVLNDAFRTSTIDNWRFERILFFFVAWVLAGQVLSLASPANRDEETQRWLIPIRAWFTPARRTNLWVFALLTLGIYLSIVAIIAIPILQTSGQAGEQVSAESFRSQIEEMRAQIALQVYPEADTSPFAVLDTYFAEQRENASNTAGAAAEATPTPGSFSNYQVIDPTLVRNILIFQQEQRQQLIDAHDKLVSDADNVLDTYATLAVQTYEVTNANRPGGREGVAHYLNVLTWYTTSEQQLVGVISTCADQIVSMDRRWRLWSQLMRDSLRRADVAEYYETLLGDQYREAYQLCDELPRAASIPERPMLGSFYGAFGLVASWLLDTESLSLALIVGMLGFGLLGALSSTAIRERILPEDPARQAGVLVSDLLGVLLRGVSAAVIVFMAGKGGLAILAEDAGEPNPYALLLICLTAAVFSEVIWKWALDQLKKFFNVDQTQNNGAPPVATTTTDAGEAALPHETLPAEGTGAESGHGTSGAGG